MEREMPLSSIESSMDYTDNASDEFLASNNNEKYSLDKASDVIHDSIDDKISSKHSSRKQSKRRRKSSNHNRPLPRIIVKPLPPPPAENREWSATLSTVPYPEASPSTSKPITMREVLASIPGFCLKPRKRSSKKLSTAAQLQQTKEGCIDLETPDSILVNTNIRSLLNKHTFSLLPPLYQFKLGQLLPSVDRPSTSGRLSSSSLNNEFFARACLEWQDSLSGGEFTPENQQKMKTEAEREKSKIDPWKLKHFEPIWGEKLRREKSSLNFNSERPSLKTTIKLRPTASITSTSTVPKIKKSKCSSSSKRLRSVGAVTRASAKGQDSVDEVSSSPNSKSSAPVPDLLPLNHTKNRGYIECSAEINYSEVAMNQRVEDSVPVPVTIPIDPLLIPESNSQEDLDLSIVTLENSKIKEQEILKNYEECYLECHKRLSDEKEDKSFSKRFKCEEESTDVNELHNYNTQNVEESISNNICSDNETACSNEVPCLTDENNEYFEHEGDVADTNSEDSKATNSLYEYDEPSPSSITSSKNDKQYCEESNVVQEESNVINLVSEESGTHSIDESNTCNENIINEPSTYVDNPSHDEFSVDSGNISNNTESNFEPLHKISSISCSPEQHKIKNEDIEESPSNNGSQDLESNSRLILVPPDEARSNKVANSENMEPSCYDDHFKDAESLIMETGDISMLSSQNEEKYIPHPNLMEMSSYMSETNATAVVTMPMTQNSSIPAMEVTNSSLVSYPDDTMQDPAKPKSSAMIWNPESDWTTSENVLNIHSFPQSLSDRTRYINEDSKTSMDDGTLNDENYICKEERDSNFNMESSNSSESSQSIKELSFKQDPETMTSVISTTVTNTTSSVSISQSSKSHSRQKGKSSKESTRSRSTHKVPPGAVNLERSYQICQAVIQNSPNRDALRSQLRPPPALMTRPARPPRPTAMPTPPVMVRQMPLAVVPHTEINDNRATSMGQYILVQRTPNVAPRASSAPPTNHNVNIGPGRCRSVGGSSTPVTDESCVCNLRAMVLCKKCGAFCHDDCIGAPDLCLTCLIR